MWHGPLFVSKRRDPVFSAVLKSDVVFENNYIYDERQVLIEAIEKWLATPAEQWIVCGDQNIVSWSTVSHTL
jgi:hypothetical protein